METGELYEGRCRATNLCEYCRTLYVVETVEMWSLSAVEVAPTMWLVLTAREHLTRADTYDHLRQLRKALRRRWPAVEWAVTIEFQRRGALHLNLVMHGVGAAACPAWLPWDHRSGEPAPNCGGCVRCVASAVWCARVDAEPQSQWAGEIDDAEGAIRYVSKQLAHGLKKEQAPPIGWRGHRTSQTRGYLARPASVMREEARSALRVKRSLWRGESLEVALHKEENRPVVELYRERGRQPGRELGYSQSTRRRAARAQTDWVASMVAYQREFTTRYDAARLSMQRERAARARAKARGADGP